MNKKLFLLAMFVLSLGLGFTACGDDEEEDLTVDYAAQIAGTYNGDLNVDLGQEGVDPSKSKQDIKLERIGENRVKLSLDNFSFASFENLGSIKIETSVTEKDGTIKLGDTTTDLSLLAGVLNCKVALSSADVKDNKLTLNIKVTDIKQGEVVLPFEVMVDFAGNKK